MSYISIPALARATEAQVKEAAKAKNNEKTRLIPYADIKASHMSKTSDMYVCYKTVQ